MSLETILLIGVLTIGAIAKLAEGIALGADCLWSLAIRSSLNPSNLTKETGYTKHFSETVVDVQRQANRFLILVLLVVLAGAIVLNIIPHSRIEPYLLTIGILSLVVALLPVSVDFIQIDRDSVSNQIVMTLLMGIRVTAELITYWSFLHYALNPKA